MSVILFDNDKYEEIVSSLENLCCGGSLHRMEYVLGIDNVKDLDCHGTQQALRTLMRTFEATNCAAHKVRYTSHSDEDEPTGLPDEDWQYRRPLSLIGLHKSIASLWYNCIEAEEADPLFAVSLGIMVHLRNYLANAIVEALPEWQAARWS